MISHDKLIDRISYDPATGEFRWRNHPWFDSFNGKIIANTPDSDGYLRVTINDKTVKLHRVAVFYMTGEWPPFEVDHINGNRGDNRWVNLRVATRAENAKNLNKMKTNTSGIPGVHWNKSEGKWQVRVMVDGKRHSGGYYSDLEKAKEKRDQLVERLHQEFGRFH